jgi:hypothetical protein
LTGYSITAVQEAGWGSFMNGKLLALAEKQFDVFVTADQNLKYQQNLEDRRLAILELSTNHRRTIERNIEGIQRAIDKIEEGAFISLSLS